MAFARAAEDGSNPVPYKPAPPAPAYTPPKKFSDEQMEIIRCDAPIVVGQAFAGTGKSTTGLGYVAHNQDKPILVICFNKANADEGKFKYPAVSKKVHVKTTHALARRYLTEKQNARVSVRWNSVTLRSEIPYVGGRGDMRTAAITASLLNEFFITTDEKVDPYIHGKAARKVLKASDGSIEQCAIYAQRLWYGMNTDLLVPGMKGDQNLISIPHDAYLKMFVMRGGNLGYHTVIFDEAQDANPIMLKLLENQYTTGTKVIMLGDRHQAIYEFRGAVNAMENLPDIAKIHPLTQSWRFGPKTAQIANFILNELKGEQLAIEGMGKDMPYESGAPMTYLSRTNADLLMRAASNNGEGVHWVGGIEGYRVNILNDAWALRCGLLDDIKDPFIKKHFPRWEDLMAAAEVDNESKILLEMVEQYNSEIPQLVENLRKNAVQNPALAQTTLSTGHKSKGLEWDHVTLADDFRNVFKSAESWLAGKDTPFPEQEVNLMYVLATRPRRSLTPNYEMEDWFDNIDSYRRKRKRDFNYTESGTSSAASTDSVTGAANNAPAVSAASSAFAKVKPFRVR